jgi:hypothetical protein
MISQQRWVDLGIIKPIKVVPTAKIEDTRLIHFPPFKFWPYLTYPKCNVKDKFLKICNPSEGMKKSHFPDQHSSGP